MNINGVDWKAYLVYNEESPSCLSTITGKNIGSIDRDSRTEGKYKRWRIIHLNKHWLAHRIIWVLFNGELTDGFEIDHIDGDALNNKITNLRKIEKAVNRRNNCKRKDNSSGYTGIQISDKMKLTRAIVKVNKKDYSKAFSWSKYGKDESLVLALEWRNSEIRKLNENEAGYTDRHGK